MTTSGTTHDEVREQVRAHYAEAATAVTPCCGLPEEVADADFGAELYDAAELAELPAGAVTVSLGCGNPILVADLREGETVLDLGSGGGIDVLLSARRVGPTGFAYGLDMTDEMLSLARRNAAEAGVLNAEFLKGDIERVPLPDESVDVVISNCVIALSVDKASVFSEAYRVLRPGGRLAVADVVAGARERPAEEPDPAAWAACVAGALTEEEYQTSLASTGFVDVSIEHSHDLGDGSTSAIVRARKANT